MPRLINFELVAQPLNWLIVFIMLFFAGIVVTLLTSAGDDENAAA